MDHRRPRLVALLVGASLLAAGLPGGAPSVRADAPSVMVDLSLGNGIATGAVVDPDPNHALVTATNRYHFWAGLDLQPPTGAATLAPATDARGIYGLLGLIGPSTTSAWTGTFGSAGGSQAVWIHYDLATPRGAQALALTCLTIAADTFGSPLLALSAAAVEHAATLITDLAKFTDLLAAVQRNDPWAIAQQWSLLLQSQAGRTAIIEALGVLGVIATDAGLKALSSVVGLIDFAQTLYDLLRAGVGGHTSGVVRFSAGVGGGTATPSGGTGGTATTQPPPTTTALPGVVIPDVRGKFEADALIALVGAGLVPGSRTESFDSTVAEGSVVETEPPAGSLVETGTPVAYVVSLGPGSVPTTQPTTRPTQAPTPNPTPSPVATKTVTVPAIDPSGVVTLQVRTGDRLHVTATGTWCMGGSGAAAECGGPAGIRAAHADEPGLVLPSATIGTLIARIGSGGWVAIGADRSFKAGSTGSLVLAFNDRADFYFDNSRSVRATIVDLH